MQSKIKLLVDYFGELTEQMGRRLDGLDIANKIVLSALVPCFFTAIHLGRYFMF